MMKAFASLAPVKFKFLMNEKLLYKIFIGSGFQFCLTPSIIKILFEPGSFVKVNGSGPANLLASFQFANGEPAGNEIFSWFK